MIEFVKDIFFFINCLLLFEFNRISCILLTIFSSNKDKDFTGKDICRKREIELYYNKRDHRFSSSDLRRRVCE